MHCTTYPKIDSEKLAKLQEAEKELGTTLVALNYDEMKPANINEEQKQRIAQLESELGLVLVAVDGD